MKVSLNPCVNKYQRSFSSVNNKNKSTETSLLSTYEKNKTEIQEKKFKTALGVALSLVVALDVVYFACKRRIITNKSDILSKNKKAAIENVKNLIAPDVQITKL